MTDARIQVGVSVVFGGWLSAIDGCLLKIDAVISRNFQALRECDSCWRRLMNCRCGGGE